jgi:hypothetical protein
MLERIAVPSNSTKRKLAFVLLHSQFTRSWLQTGILNDLRSEYEVDLFVPFDLKPLLMDFGLDVDEAKVVPASGKLTGIAKAIMAAGSDNFTRIWRFLQRRHFLGLLSLSARNHRDWSSLLLAYKEALRVAGSRFLKSPLSILVFILPRRLRRYISNILYALQLKTRKWTSFIHLLRSYAVVVVPSNNSENELELLNRGMKLSSTEIFLVLDNWDNLTSKLSFQTNPSYISVMGPSAKWRAISTFGFDSHQVFPIGLPKMEILHKHQVAKKTHRTLKIAYMGFAQNQYEHSLVNQLVPLLDAKVVSEIHYRPHPFRITMPVEEEQLDPRITFVGHNESDLRKHGNYPSLNSDYVQSLAQYALVICGPTTIALEAVALGIPILIDLRKQPELITSPGSTLGLWPHFEDLFLIEGLSTFSDDRECIDKAIELLNSPPSYRAPIVFPGSGFSSRLISVLDRILMT